MPISLLEQRLKQSCSSVDINQGKLTGPGSMRDLGININRYIKACFSSHSMSWYMAFYVILSLKIVYVKVGILNAAKSNSEFKLNLLFFIPVATYSWKNEIFIVITYISPITAVCESQNHVFIYLH